MQLDAVTHEIATREPVAAGTATTDHAAPFHRSTRGLRPAPWSAPPTAKQTVGSGQDTWTSPVCAAPGGSGRPTIDQREPFQCSASFLWTEPSKYCPTAKHSVVVAHATPERVV